jgi:hypothetical protein
LVPTASVASGVTSRGAGAAGGQDQVAAAAVHQFDQRLGNACGFVGDQAVHRLPGRGQGAAQPFAQRGQPQVLIGAAGGAIGNGHQAHDQFVGMLAGDTGSGGHGLRNLGKKLSGGADAAVGEVNHGNPEEARQSDAIAFLPCGNRVSRQRAGGGPCRKKANRLWPRFPALVPDMSAR